MKLILFELMNSPLLFCYYWFKISISFKFFNCAIKPHPNFFSEISKINSFSPFFN